MTLVIPAYVWTTLARIVVAEPRSSLNWDSHINRSFSVKSEHDYHVVSMPTRFHESYISVFF